MPEVGGAGQDLGTVQSLYVAADAGQIAVAPHTGEAVIRQLTKVQDEVAKMRRDVMQAAVDPKFGGGYAEQVSRFVQGVAAGQAGSAEEVLDKYWNELEQLKSAVAKSIGTYQATDAGSAHGITSAGGPL
jgi:hypothetical protein